jgi:hypothetical protein
MTAPTRATGLLRGLTELYAQPPGIGCNTAAHRDFGFCALCVARTKPQLMPTFGISTELAAWRLLAETDTERPDQTERTA